MFQYLYDRVEPIHMVNEGKTMIKKTRICFLVTNNIINDPRVQKQASGAGTWGYDSIAVGFYWPGLQQQIPYEKKETFEIFRVTYEPFRTLFYHKDAPGIVRFIFFRLFSTWLWYLTKGHHLEQKSVKAKNSPVLSKPRKFSPLWKRVLSLPFRTYSFVYHIFVMWYGLFDYYLSLTVGLADKAIELNPQIVHCNDLDSLWAGYLVKQKTGAKLVFDAHEFWLDMGLKVPKPFILAYKLSEKYLLKKIDAYVTVNQPILEKTENYYAHKFTVPAEVVYNCPNYEKVGFKKPDPRKIKVLYQGRYARNRGLEQLAEAARYLPDNVEVGFRGVKDIVIEEELARIAKMHKVESKVKILKEVSMTDMVKAAKVADIGVIPYVPVHIDNRLASPNKLFEYMMAGLALACSDLPVLRYFVKKYKNGVLFNPRNPKSIATALNYLISHPEKLVQMKKNSLEAAKEMNWEKEQEKLVKIYEEILAK